MHLYRNKEEVWDVYVNSLSYDVSWYREIGPKLKAKLEHTKELVITSNVSGNTCSLTVTGGLESPKLNIGDYTGMENIGGTFPIGEVFTEAKTLHSMNGNFMIYAYADSSFNVNINTPFKVEVKDGLIVSYDKNAPTSFTEIYTMVKDVERPILREIGFGLNRAITKERYLEDITAFERILGMHLSFGEKHGTYKKEDINVQKSRFHVDLFLVVDEVTADGEIIFKDREYLV
jgi:leucyl aminopeptidase (aminopeptidase T)